MSGHEIERGATRNRKPRSQWFQNQMSCPFDVSTPGKLDRFSGIQSPTDLAFTNRSRCFHITRRIVLTLTELLCNHLRWATDDAEACDGHERRHVVNAGRLSRDKASRLRSKMTLALNDYGLARGTFYLFPA